MSIRTRLVPNQPHPHMGPLISSYQDGLATPGEANLVERHLLECEHCRSFYGGLPGIPAPSSATCPHPSRSRATRRHLCGYLPPHGRSRPS